MKTHLRALTFDDASNTVEWNNQQEIKEFYSSHPFFVNIENEKKWYEKILYSNIPTSVFGIEHTKDKLLIGLSFLTSIDIIHRTAEFAIYIGDNKYRGMGLSKEATFLTIDFGFTNLGLHRISLRVSDNNQTAIHLYEKCGFKTEGLLRECYFINGKYVNKIQMSLLQNEFDRVNLLNILSLD
ncbi:MAG: GNAT family N-acetyltransferase [Lentimicrobiaceae bacterium]|jgi:RimJ/RimL family protein N-acetyltransferase